MFRTTVSATLRFDEREPWESQHIVVFDEGLRRCVALTHNDQANFVRVQPDA